MADKTVQKREDLLTMYTATLFAFPLAGTPWGFGVGQEKKVAETAWKGYDAWVRLASASIDDLYRTPLFGDVLGRALDRWVRWQRLNQGVVGTFFAALWPTVGLPTAAAVQALHEELSSLDIRLQAQDATAQTRRGELRALQTLREELRFLTAEFPTQRQELRAEREERRAALPVQSNGNGAGTYTARAGRHKKLANGHGAKERRESDVVTH
jgi:hypothetical protein